jgi:hypothetical protein
MLAALAVTMRHVSQNGAPLMMQLPAEQTDYARLHHTMH